MDYLLIFYGAFTYFLKHQTIIQYIALKGNQLQFKLVLTKHLIYCIILKIKVTKDGFYNDATEVTFLVPQRTFK